MMIKTSLRYTVKLLFQVLLYIFSYPFRKDRRHALSNAYLALNYPFYGSGYIDLSGIIRNDELEVRVAPVKSNEHNTTEFELLSICSIIKDRAYKNIFEIGTYDGRTTRAMAMNVLKKGKIFTLNLPPELDNVLLKTDLIDVHLASKVISGNRFHQTEENNLIVQLWGDSANFDFSPYHKMIDLVFIDGAHSLEYVESDTLNALNMIDPSGGVIVWHDAHLYGVKDYLMNLIFLQKIPIYFIKGTSLAIAYVINNEFSKNYNFK